MAALLALASAVTFGVSDFTGGLASRRAPLVNVVLLVNSVSLLLALLAVAFLPGSTYRGTDLAWGMGAGVVGVAGELLLYRGLAMGPMSVVAPLTALLTAVVPVLVGILRGERPGTVALIGVALVLPAIVLIGREAKSGVGARLSRGALFSAICAGVSFGGFFVLLAQTGPNGGAWPVVGQRAISILLLLPALGVALVRHTAGRTSIPAIRLAVMAGATDFAANLAYVLATHRGLLALVAVITSLYPATTLILARGVLKERIVRHQAVGLVLAAAAVVLIALH